VSFAHKQVNPKSFIYWEPKLASKYRVTVKYGNPGGPLNTSTTITVEASSESVAMSLAISKFKASNSSNRNKDVEAVKIEEL
jgi:hypothetical protein